MATGKPGKTTKATKATRTAKVVRSRRQEVRKTVGTRRRSLRAMLSGRQMAWGLFFALAFWLCAATIILQARKQPPYVKGELADRPVVARVDFDWIDPESTRYARREAREATPNIYRPNPAFFAKLREELTALPKLAAAADTVESLNPALRDRFALQRDPTLELLKSFVVEGEVTTAWTERVGRFVDEMRWMPIVRHDRYETELTDNLRVEQIGLKLPDGAVQRVSDKLMVDLRELRGEAALSAGVREQLHDLAARFPEGFRPSVIAYLRSLDQPSYAFDVEATERAREAAVAEVEPQYRRYQRGRPLFEAGQRVTEIDESLMRLERAAYLDSLDGWKHWVRRGGIAGVALLGALGLSVVVLFLRPRIAQNPMRGLALTLLMLATLGLAVLIRPVGPGLAAAAAVAAASLASVIVCIAYDRQFAAAVGAVHVWLIAMALGLSVGIGVAVLTAVVVMVGQLRQVRQRGTLIRSGVVAGLAAAVAVFCAGVAERNAAPGIYAALGVEAAWAAGGSVIVGFFVLGVLPFVERAFKVTTAMTLLELSDVHQPLLRKLAQEASGTYNHSLNVAIMAESAAEAIGADGLLCRVGAYYHDIGKINKPGYFIENQAGGPNRHEKLSPAMSLLIIVGHVKDGLEMAREYNLPASLHHFIESHHGTTLVEYFYHAAQKRKGEGNSQPSEFEFRYPGPKPQTREAAILMLCDTAESAARSIVDPTPNKIEQLVHKLAMKRLMDGQFDESNLTLEEVHRIEESITRSLVGIHHGRIKYPSDKPASAPESDAAAPDRPAEASPEPRPAAG